jgi:hypothetical protein
MKRRRKVSTEPQTPLNDSWLGLSSRVQHAVCLVFLAILAVVLIPEIWQGKQLVQHDVIQWRGAAESLQQPIETTGEQVLWSTHMFSGMPAYVISGIARYPSVDTLLSSIRGWDFAWVYLFMLLTGAYLFLIQMGASKLSAVFGAVIIGFTTYIPIIIGAGHNTKFWAYVWIPWMFMGYRMMTTGRLAEGYALFTFFLMLNVRAGHPQVTYYFLFLLAVWWIFETYSQVRQKDVRGALTHTGLLTIGGIAAGLSELPRQLALLEFTPHSIRGGSALAETASTGLSTEYAFVWSQGWGELLTLIVPNLYGGSMMYWGPKPFTSGPHYLGALAFVFLLFALYRYRDRITQVFLISALLGLLFSLGKHFTLLNEFMFHWFPLFNKFRTPEMWLLLTCFSLAVPATLALDKLFREPDWLTSGRVWGAVGGALAVGLLLFALSGGAFRYEKPGEIDRIAQQIAQQNQVSPQDERVRRAAVNFVTETRQERQNVARKDILRYLLLVALAAGAIWLMRSGKLPSSYALAIIVIISSLEMVQAGKRYIPDQSFMQRTGNTLVDYIERSRRPAEDWLQQAVETDEGWQWRVLPMSENPFNNAIPSYFYPSAGGYTAAKMSNYQDIIDHAMFSGPIGINTRVLDMLNVRYLMIGGRVSLPGFVPVHESDGRVIYENTRVLPKAWFVEEVMQATSRHEAMRLLNDPEVDLSSVAIVEGAGKDQTGYNESVASVQVTAYTPHRIQLSTDAPEGGFLVVSEVFYRPGWKALADGVEIPIHTANYVLRGLEVPPGTREIVMEFQPDWLRMSKTVSLIFHLLVHFMLVFAGWSTYQRWKAPAGSVTG